MGQENWILRLCSVENGSTGALPVEDKGECSREMVVQEFEILVYLGYLEESWLDNLMEF